MHTTLSDIMLRGGYIIHVVLLIAVVAVHQILAASVPSGRALPTGIKPCPRNHPNIKECIMENAKKAQPIVVKGIRAYKVQPLDPLYIPRILIDDTGTGRRIAIKLDLKDINMIGLENTKLTNVDMLPDSHKVTWEGRAPILQFLGEYEVSGRILILPIVGNGAINITLENVDFGYTFDMKIDKEHEGQKYAKASNNMLRFNTTRCYTQLDNLFGGDKRLSDNMNVFLNENWRELVEDLGGPISQALNAAFSQLINNLLDQVPYDSIYPKE